MSSGTRSRELRALGLMLMAFAATPCSQAAPSTSFSWEVVNRFPLMSSDAFGRLQNALLDSPATKPSADPAASIESRIVQLDLRRQVQHLADLAWDRRTERYDVARLFSPVAEIRLVSTQKNGRCRWTAQHMGSQSKVAREESCAVSAILELRLDEPYLIEVEVDGQIVGSESVKVRSSLVVGLGDSFASGEGNPDYPAVFSQGNLRPRHDWAIDRSTRVASRLVRESAEWMDDTCHRSLVSWPALVALQRAITEKDSVVQFASFACSGAKVVDGFLFPQTNPPGHLVDLDPTIGRAPASQVGRSQLQALLELVCHGRQQGGQRTLDVSEIRDVIRSRDRTWRDRQMSLPSCLNARPIDDLFVLFGGNDTGFSGVVAYLLDPQDLRWRNALARDFMNERIKERLSPLPAATAAQRTVKLGPLYAAMAAALQEAGISASRITLLKYPDPTVSSQSTRLADELEACQARTRDGNRPLQSLMEDTLRRTNPLLAHANARFGVNPDRYQKLSSEYVQPLRQAQAKFLPPGWRLVDTQPAFNGRSFCAGSLECERMGQGCADGDRVRWQYPAQEPVAEPSPLGDAEFRCVVPRGRAGGPPLVFSCTPAMPSLEHFRAYDQQRQRGLLYANDALLSSARMDGTRSRLLLDWVTGIAHPTGVVHALIATELRRSLSREPRIASR